MEIRHLKYFCTAAEEGSISRAARRLFVSQPAVSRLIHDMEEELGGPLFQRSRQGLQLTAAGERLLGYARQILCLFNEALTMTAHGGTPERTVHIGFLSASLTSYIAPMLGRLRELCPGVTVKLHELLPGEQIERLRKRVVDLALLGSPCGSVKDEFATALLRQLPQNVILPAKHRLARRKDIALEDLRTETFVGFNEDVFPGRNQMIQRSCAAAGFAPQLGSQAEGLVALLGMVGSGGGVSIVPNEVASLPHPGVVFRPLRDHMAPEQFSVVWRRDDTRPMVRCLVDAMLGMEGKQGAEAE